MSSEKGERWRAELEEKGRTNGAVVGSEVSL